MRKILYCLAAMALCFIIGCAGGSRGSGGQLFGGSVSDASGRSLSGVTVTILQTGDSTVTDANGQYAIETDELQGTVEFLLESPTFAGTAQARDIPADALRIQVNFEVSTGTTPDISAEVDVKERKPVPTARPTPSDHSPTPAPGQSSSSQSSSQGFSSSSEVGGSSSSSSIGESSSSEGSSSSEDSGHGSSNSSSSSSSSNGSGGTPGGSGKPTPTVTPTPNGGIPDGTVIDQEGTITSINASEVVINGTLFAPTATTEYKGKSGASATLQSFATGDKARARGRVAGGVVNLERLEAR